MTATRMGSPLRLATLAVLAGAWAVAAYVLWNTSRVPGNLHISGLHAGDFFSRSLLRAGDRYEQFLWINSLLAIAVTIIVFVLYARWGTRFLRDSAAGPIGSGMLLAMLGFGLVWLVGLPFQIAALWWDRRHDVSNASYWEVVFGGWIGLGVEFTFLCLAVLVVMGFAKLLGDKWWIPGAVFFVGLYALFTFVSSYLITGTHSFRSENPALAVRAEALAKKEGVGGIPVRVQIVHGQTSSANAFATGFGPSRKVFLWDTLLDGRFSDRQVLFVLSHEFGHQVRLHLVKGIAWYALFAFPGAYIIARVTRRRGGMQVPEAVPLALLVLVVLHVAATPLQAGITRHIEQEADWMALQTTRDPQAGQQLFQKFAKTSLGDPNPPTWAYLWFEDHPTLMQRIGMTRAWAARNGITTPGASPAGS